MEISLRGRGGRLRRPLGAWRRFEKAEWRFALFQRHRVEWLFLDRNGLRQPLELDGSDSRARGPLYWPIRLPRPDRRGNAQRFSVSGQWAKTDAGNAWQANVFAVRSALNLWNDFTYFLQNPTFGDQFHQHETEPSLGPTRLIR